MAESHRQCPLHVFWSRRRRYWPGKSKGAQSYSRLGSDCHIGVPASCSDIHWNRRPSLSEFFFSFNLYYRANCDTKFSQTAKAVSDSQVVLATVFERIENFFRRLETYVEVPSTTGMTDMIVKIMVEVLSILSIATKEIKQNRTSESIIGITN